MAGWTVCSWSLLACASALTQTPTYHPGLEYTSDAVAWVSDELCRLAEFANLAGFPSIGTRDPDTAQRAVSVLRKSLVRCARVTHKSAHVEVGFRSLLSISRVWPALGEQTSTF